ncbi:hypothetical protein ADUPG1_005698, partial [Aduncisulcus paluster]
GKEEDEKLKGKKKAVKRGSLLSAALKMRKKGKKAPKKKIEQDKKEDKKEEKKEEKEEKRTRTSINNKLHYCYFQIIPRIGGVVKSTRTSISQGYRGSSTCSLSVCS